MMRPDAKVEKVYLYPKPVDFRKSIDGLAVLVELDIKVAMFDPVLFVFLNRHRNRVKILYWGVSRTLASASDAVSKMGVGLPESACRSLLAGAGFKPPGAES
ncbi:IS66 family insertion sequence element accessory protein TnpB, partial [Pseudomonas syringae]|uniref:IS66 family insertion sequence element accessory protein TnpB n=2 Tax=Pseudomonas syringae TaxID=317 RepID=UPI001F530A25